MPFKPSANDNVLVVYDVLTGEVHATSVYFGTVYPKFPILRGARTKTKMTISKRPTESGGVVDDGSIKSGYVVSGNGLVKK